MSCEFLLILFLCCLVKVSLCDPRATEAALICTNRTTASSSQRQFFIANFVQAINSVTPLLARQGYAAVVNGSDQNTQVYAFGECMRDLSQTDCNLCFAQCKIRILNCLPFQLGTRGGRLFCDGCYFRYDSYDFFNETWSDQDKTICGNTSFEGNRKGFRANVVELVRNLSLEAAKNDGFYLGYEDKRNMSVYGLAQCWRFVKGSTCQNCLGKAVNTIDSCPPRHEGRVLNAGCYVRYSTQKFYNNSGNAAHGTEGRRRVIIIVAATSSTFSLLLVIITIIFSVRKIMQKRRSERKQLRALSSTLSKSKLNIHYEVLETATDYFNNAKKLGQGGSGSVYKGVLPDGNIVAIKRLFFNTSQWVDHFFNEINLISGIHHKNLVKLIGCSITGPESLLVYEYVPNQSLHDYLFGVKKNSQPLRWDVRYKIILGTAEGLAYLHEESQVRIIHRDIKLSNILLDEDFTPKISDFGLSRLFPEEKTHISTAVVGTLGYMAPEYAVRGKLTEKADVYSFGVVVIEVVCGRTNNSSSQNSIFLLEMVWNLYKAGRVCDAIDPVLEVDIKKQGDACRVLQIGLLCVQASAGLRPPMPLVVKMLNDNLEVPQPTQPPFIYSHGREINEVASKEGCSSQFGSATQSSGNSAERSGIDPR